MIETMKLLILTLFLTISAQAQTVADVARQERERRAHLKTTTVIAAEGVRNATTVSTQPAGDPKPVTPDKKTPAPAVSAPTPGQVQPPDPVKDWTERAEKLRK